MEILARMKEEKHEATRNMHSAFDYSFAFTEYIKNLSDFFENLSTNMSSLLSTFRILKNPISAIGADKKYPIAPGIPGGATQFYSTFFQTLNFILNHFSNVEINSKKTIIQKLASINEEHIIAQNSLLEKVNKAKLLRHEAKIAFVEASSVLKTQTNLIEKIHTEYMQKQSNNHRNHMKQAAALYQKAAFQYNTSYSVLLKRHKAFLETCHYVAIRIKVFEISRECQIKSIMTTVNPGIESSASGLKDLALKMSAPNNYADDFVYFAVRNGIFRTEFVPAVFKPFNFTFKDSRIDIPLPPSADANLPLPTCFAEAIDDVQSEKPGFLQLKKGERVCLFQLPAGDIVFAESESSRGFVRLQHLRVLEAKTALVVAPCLARSAGDLSAPAGTLLFNLGDGKFEDRAGRVGRVDPSFLLME